MGAIKHPYFWPPFMGGTREANRPKEFVIAASLVIWLSLRTAKEFLSILVA